MFGRGVEGTWLKIIQKMVPDEPTSGHVPSTPRIKHCKSLLLNKKKGRRFWQDHLCIYYVVIEGRFAPPYKYMVKYIKQKQQQKQQLEGQGRVGDR